MSQNAPNTVMITGNIPDATGLFVFPKLMAITAIMPTITTDIVSMANVHNQNSLRPALPLNLKYRLNVSIKDSNIIQKYFALQSKYIKTNEPNE